MAAPGRAQPQEVEPNTFVVVWSDARFYRSPDDPAPVRAYDFGPAGRRDRAGQFYAMRLLEVDGEWLRVTDPRRWLRKDGTSIHCVESGLFSMEPFGIELWVHRSDLVRVLSRPFEQRYDDGSFAKLLPGTPIVDGKPWAEGYRLPVAPPKQSIALRYQPAEAGVLIPEAFSTVQADKVQFSLGGEPVQWQQQVFDYAKTPYFRVNRERTRSFEASGCGAFELAFHGHVLDDSDGMEDVMMGVIGSQKRVPGIEIPAGTELMWPGGGRAGVMLKAFRKASATKADGGNTCLKVPVGTKLKAPGYRGDTLTVCVRSSAVHSVETSSTRHGTWR